MSFKLSVRDHADKVYGFSLILYMMCVQRSGHVIFLRRGGIVKTQTRLALCQATLVSTDEMHLPVPSICHSLGSEPSLSYCGGISSCNVRWHKINPPFLPSAPVELTCKVERKNKYSQTQRARLWDECVSGG